MANLNALVEFFQNNPQIITQLTSGKLDMSGIMSLLKQKGIEAAQSEVQQYIAKNFNVGDLASMAGSILGGSNSKASAAASAIGALGSLLGKK